MIVNRNEKPKLNIPQNPTEWAILLFRFGCQPQSMAKVSPSEMEIKIAMMRRDAERRTEYLEERRNYADLDGLVLRSKTHRALLQVFAHRIVCKHKYRYPDGKRPNPPTDHNIHGFSRASRKRMIDGLASWKNLTSNCYFITLTYHEEWGEHFSAWKRDIDVIIKRMKREFPTIGGVWKLEFQRRGAPHFHLIVCAEEFKTRELLMNWFTQAWGEIAHENSVYKGEYATRVDYINGHRHAMHYAAKYMSKETPQAVDEETGEILGDIATGRCWAFFGNVDRTPVSEIPLTWRAAKGAFYAAHQILIDRESRYAERFGERKNTQTWSMYGIGANVWNVETIPITDFIAMYAELQPPLDFEIQLASDGY